MSDTTTPTGAEQAHAPAADQASAFAKAIAEAVQEAMRPVTERLDALGKPRVDPDIVAQRDAAKAAARAAKEEAAAKVADLETRLANSRTLWERELTRQRALADAGAVDAKALIKLHPDLATVDDDKWADALSSAQKEWPRLFAQQAPAAPPPAAPARMPTAPGSPAGGPPLSTAAAIKAAGGPDEYRRLNALQAQKGH